MGPNPPNLIHDVWLQILSFCNIASVLAVSEICRSCHDIAFTKQVWLALLRDLEARLFLDQLPRQPLHELSTVELVELVKRIVHGPRTWCPAHAAERIITYQHTILHPSLRFHKDATILPGGRHVLLQRWDTLECWGIAEGKAIWTHESQWPHERVTCFAADVVDEGRAAVIVICRTSSSVEVVRLDFLAESSSHLLTLPICASDHRSAKIYGNIVGLWDGTSILLIKLATQEAIKFEPLGSPYPIIADIAVVNDHVIFVGVVEDGVVQINIWTEKSLAPFWSPIVEQPIAALWDTMRFCSETVQVSVGCQPVYLGLSAHISLLREDVCKIWVGVSGYVGNWGAWTSALWSYRLSLPQLANTRTVSHLQQLSSVVVEDEIDFHSGITYSGHTAVYRKHQTSEYRDHN